MNLKELVKQINELAGSKIAAKEFKVLNIKPKDAYGYIGVTIEIDGLKYKGSFKENCYLWHITCGESGEQFNPILTDEQAAEFYEFLCEQLHKEELKFWTEQKATAEKHLAELENDKK